MKKNIFLIVITLLVISLASTMSYEQQTIVPQLKTLLKNEPFKETLSKIEVVYWGNLISIETKGYIYFIEFMIRKATHFIGYGIVSLIFYTFYRKLGWRLAPLFAIGTVFIIGCIDEFLQYHTPGRTGIFDDVLLDTSGAIFFILITVIIQAFIAKRKGGRRITR